MFSRVISCAGLGVFVGLAFILSEHRESIRWRLVGWGFALQVIVALVVLKTRIGMLIFTGVRIIVDTLIGFSDRGDSGSLIVTIDDCKPVGLLFAGNTDITIANKIDVVLDALRVQIDGK